MTERRGRGVAATGFIMIEVLVALALVLIGILGLLGLQSRAHQGEMEAYQRTQALVTHTIARLQFWNNMGILYIKENGQWEEIRDDSGPKTEEAPQVEQPSVAGLAGVDSAGGGRWNYRTSHRW